MTKAPSAEPRARIWPYFARERRVLLGVAVTGVAYNVGLAAIPWLEGALAQRLADIIGGSAAAASMVALAALYLLANLVVQGARFLKRLFVRTFANNVNRRMKKELYGQLVSHPRGRTAADGAGDLITRALSDVDDCVEGMRKVTTEIFDTGVVMVAYVAELLLLDWRLALVCLAFPPVAYALAELLRRRVTGATAAAKRAMSDLNAETLDRVEGALTYRTFGLEAVRDEAYERRLSSYERAAVRAGVWESVPEPIYRIISMAGFLFIIWLGGQNVLGLGWCAWDIAAFTTFTSCFTRLATKSSHAAKLFNAVQRARVSWARIAPLLPARAEGAQAERASEGLDEPASSAGAHGGGGDQGERPAATGARVGQPARPGAAAPARPRLVVRDLCVWYPSAATAEGDAHGKEAPAAAPAARPILRDVSLSVGPGQIVGVTGAVASGKSTLGRALVGELDRTGDVLLDGRDLRGRLAAGETVVGYLGHDPELLGDTVAENVSLGGAGDVMRALRLACLDEEVAALPQGVMTQVGPGGVRLSGGQQARLGLARALFDPHELIVLDDPFSAVDRATERRMLDNLRALAREQGSAVVLISHRLELFGELDGVVYLHDGTAAVGSHAELLEGCAGYARLCALQGAGGSPASDGAATSGAGGGDRDA